ncbi:PAS domain-containing sensor histidine kinase [Halolactibacillus miurensis]|uniref:histidine kinase n=1 Tax=Halolactibacillus miurensis TaxID=306541 RepID=A0A1I6U8B4_9BACI|nr:HAMP domain-containing sensor histidine kinase [Halolactibacillus miurensis]GEM05021.1 PAS domain-containing sensor histidine kinase [Halolactibacillus miurensis]SFS97664.1 two-component system, OmpR family, phosphate regulon sensor histidine kinase PhoR [Halolactibacillus miurensis]
MTPNRRLFFIQVLSVSLLFFTLVFTIVPLVSGSSQYIVFFLLTGAYFAIILLFYQVYKNYVRPVKHLIDTIESLVSGNYKVRVHEDFHADTGRLQGAINELARHLQDLNRQEKMHARQLNSVIENMASGVMLIDQQGYVHLVNKRFVDLFGLTRDRYTESLYYEVLTQNQIHETVQEVFLYEQPIKNEMTLTKDLTTYHLEVIGAPYFNQKHDLRGAVLVFHDVTEFKRLEQMRKDFVANVSHELRTPITSIKGFAETMLEDELDPQLEQRFLSIIHKESHRLQLLIQDLLDLSKLEKADFHLNYQTISVDALIKESVEMAKVQAKEKSITLMIEGDHGLMLSADYDRLKQVVLNLIYNAINYTPSDGKVTVSAFESSGYIKIQVIDNGIGIEPEVLPRIFERFYRVDKARSRNTGGTGLGLSITKHIVEAHHGQIFVDSVVDEGSTFTIMLPKEQA